MKKNFLSTLLLLFLTCIFEFSNAQNPSWNWVKWSDGTQTTIRSTCADAQGNLYATGSFVSQTKFDTTTLKASQNAAFIAKYGPTGTFIWARAIKNTGFLAADAKSIAVDATGNLYVCGAYSGSIEAGTKTLTGGSHYLAKYDNTGKFIWVINTSGSNAVATNSSYVYVAGGSIIQKFNSSGVETWASNGVKDNQGYTNYFSVALNKAGNIVVAGDIDDKWTIGGVTITGGFQNILVIELSQDGNTNWYKVFGSNTYGGDHVQHITIDGYDNIIMTGRVGGTTKFDAVNLGAKSGYLVKLNSQGVAQWGTLTTNTSTLYGDGGAFVSSDAGNAVYVTGGYGSADVTDGGSKIFVKAIKNGANAFVLKFNATGVFQSALTNTENATINNSRGMALASSGNNMYFGGVCAPNSEWGTLKVTGYGSVFSKIDFGITPGSIKNDNSGIAFSLYPNPVHQGSSLYLDFKPTDISETVMSIVNVTGQIVYTSKISQDHNLIETGDLSKGVYVLQIQSPISIISKKLVIE